MTNAAIAVGARVKVIKKSLLEAFISTNESVLERLEDEIIEHVAPNGKKLRKFKKRFEPYVMGVLLRRGTSDYPYIVKIDCHEFLLTKHEVKR